MLSSRLPLVCVHFLARDGEFAHLGRGSSGQIHQLSLEMCLFEQVEEAELIEGQADHHPILDHVMDLGLHSIMYSTFARVEVILRSYM